MLRPAALLLALTLAPVAAYAGGASSTAAELRPDPPGKWRVLRVSDPPNSCGGALTSPVCAVEMSITCWARVRPELCDRVELDPAAERNFSIGSDRPKEYRIDWIGQYRKAVPDRYLEAGDVIVATLEKGCLLKDPDCRRPTVTKMWYLARKVGAEWKIVGASVDGHI